MFTSFRTYFVVALFFSTLMASSLRAQCPPPATVFTDQAQLDAFAANYPNCSLFTGNLVIQEARPGAIQSLSGLRNLQEVDGNLIIRLNRDLQDLRGLSSLRRISGELNIQSNGQLSRLRGLERLNYVGSQMMIVGNPALINVDALVALKRVNGSCFIHKNPALQQITGLAQLLQIAGDLVLRENPSLTSLDGLEALQQIGHSSRSQLEITDNPRLNSITALAALDFSKLTYLEITKCPSLSTVGRSNQTTVLCSYLSNNGRARIHGNGAGFDSLEAIRQTCR